jgi:RHS repeat-associated protein
VNYPQGRFLAFKYDQENKVSQIMKPGPQGQETEIYKIEYHKLPDQASYRIGTLAKPLKIATVTSFDRIDTYTFRRKRLEKIHFQSRVHLKDKPAQLEERFFWNEDEKAPFFGNLMVKALSEIPDEGGRAEYQSGWRYVYDDRQNIQEEIFFGHLTGKSVDRIELSEKGEFYRQPNECFKKRSTYSKDAFNLKLTEQEDGGPLISHTYYPNTNLLASTLTVADGQIVRRQFSLYNDDAVLTRQIVDNGSSKEESNLVGVTERRILEIEPEEDPEKPGFSQARAIRTLYLDRASGREVLLKETRHEYEKGDLIKKTEEFDALGCKQYELNYKYGPMSTLIEETDALGRVTQHCYDANKNCIRSEMLGSGFYTQKSYDYNNQLIAAEQVHSDGVIFKERYEYDLLGRKAAFVDHFGERTSYSYDFFGREIEVKLPPVQKDGRATCPVRKKKYNITGGIIFEMDENGYSETAKRNSYGSPVEIIDRLGGKESFEYHLNGTLAKCTHKNGSYTTYSYDAFKHPVKECTFSKQGVLLTQKQRWYDAFHLIREKDQSGKETHYRYDGAGRLEERVEEDGSCQRRTTYSYDAMGRLFETKIWSGEGPADFIATLVLYDVLDRPISTEVRDGFGNLKKRERNTYDFLGDLVETLVDIEEGVSAVNVYTYNSRHEVTSATDPLGHQTRYFHNYAYQNGLGQYVLQKTTVDPNGTQQIETFDALSRRVSLEVKDPLGKVIAYSEYAYDLVGNVILEKDSIFDPQGERLGFYVIDRQYDPAGHLKRMIEQPQEAPKETIYCYNSMGQLEATIKPDGVTVQQTYNALGLVEEMTSSDGSVHECYAYDSMGHLVCSKDMNLGVETARTYNAFNELTREQFINGLSVTYSYDLLGRVSLITLPDGSSASYTYSGPDLQEVARIDAEGKVIGRHTYAGADLRGKAKSVQLSKCGMQALASYDLLGRVSTIHIPGWSLSIPQHGYDPVGNLRQVAVGDPLGKETYSFNYDSLYQLNFEEGPFKHSYAYDSLRNRRKMDERDYQISPLNQVLSDAKAIFSYDKNGNLLRKEGLEGEILFSYDALNRLTSMKMAKKQRVTYRYDSFGRRTQKHAFSWQADSAKWESDYVQEFFYQGNAELGAIHSLGLKEVRIFGKSTGSDIGSAVLMEIDGQAFAPIHDLRGNLAALVDCERGEIAEFYRTSSFGERLAYNKEGELQAQEKTPWGFASKRFDPESGLTYFGCRYYDRELGRWLTPDPSGFSDGPNLYGYALNNPYRFGDHFGLASVHITYYASPQCTVASHFIQTSTRESDLFTSPRWLPAGNQALNNAWQGVVRQYFQHYRENLLKQSVQAAVQQLETQLAQHRISESQFVKAIKAQVDYIKHVAADLVEEVNDLVYGPTHTQLYNEHLFSQGIGFINGMSNSYEHFKSNAKYLAGLAGLEGIAGVYYNQRDHTAPGLLQKGWDMYFKNAPSNAIFLQIAHSLGVSRLKEALASYPRELRNRIAVVAIAPASYINKKECYSAVHYEVEHCSRDPIPRGDPLGKHKAKGTIHYLKSDPDEAYFDHSFQSKTYRESLEKHIDEFNQINKGFVK